MSKANILNITTNIKVYNTEKDLSPADKKLMAAAYKAVENAYAPYSNFNVGAAVLLSNGKIITGNNQENAAYPSGTCAERAAVFYAASQYENIKIKAIAIVSKSNNKKYKGPVSPCGACRQVLAEYEKRGKNRMRIIMGSSDGKIYEAESVESMLPLLFGREQL
jgi:cytidine deaminase